MNLCNKLYRNNKIGRNDWSLGLNQNTEYTIYKKNNKVNINKIHINKSGSKCMLWNMEHNGLIKVQAKQ